MHMSRANVAREINQAQALAKLNVPAMASFDAEVRMNEAFVRAAAAEREVVAAVPEATLPAENRQRGAGRRQQAAGTPPVEVSSEVMIKISGCWYIVGVRKNSYRL